MFPVFRGCFAAVFVVAGMLFASAAPLSAQEPQSPRPTDTPAKNPSGPAAIPAAVPDSITEGTVSVGGQAIAYRAVAGTITVAGTDPQDATLGFDGKPLPDSGIKPTEEAPPTARMFYAAYFKKDAVETTPPITFIFNGGPGSPTMWLHMGTFAPKRIVTPDTQHQTAGPYQIVPNEDSLLDVSDLVFIDAPGTGLSRTFGKNKGEAFYGVDADGHSSDSSAAFCRSTTVGTRRSTCSAKATVHRAARCWRRICAA